MHSSFEKGPVNVQSHLPGSCSKALKSESMRSNPELLPPPSTRVTHTNSRTLDTSCSLLKRGVNKAVSCDTLCRLGSSQLSRLLQTVSSTVRHVYIQHPQRKPQTWNMTVLRPQRGTINSPNSTFGFEVTWILLMPNPKNDVLRYSLGGNRNTHKVSFLLHSSKAPSHPPATGLYLQTVFEYHA